METSRAYISPWLNIDISKTFPKELSTNRYDHFCLWVYQLLTFRCLVSETFFLENGPITHTIPDDLVDDVSDTNYALLPGLFPFWENYFHLGEQCGMFFFFFNIYFCNRMNFYNNIIYFLLHYRIW